MSVFDQIEEKTIQMAVEKMVAIAARGSDDALMKVISVVEKITTNEYWSGVIRSAREKFKAGHPGAKLAMRFLRDINPNVRNKVLRNFIVKEGLIAPNKRHRILKKEGFYPPSLVVISPTMRCNLKCYGCYAGNYTKDQDLPFEEFDRIIREGKELGIFFYVISGGEPFFYPGIMDLFEKHSDCCFQVYTNGTLLDDETCARIVELGNVWPCISVEGFEKETDERRGKGTFKRITQAMESLNKRKGLFGFSLTVTRKNAEFVMSDEFIDEWVNRGCFLGWVFIYIPIGRNPDVNLMPTPEQRRMVGQRVRYFRATRPIFIADFWNDGDYVDGCIAGAKKYLHINCHGDVEPCVFAHFAVDNIKGKSLKEVINSPFFRKIKSKQPFNKDHRLPCMIIDNPEILREVVRETGARPTHPGAETLITTLSKDLDAYARAMREQIRKEDEAKKAVVNLAQ
ncbi:MAG TPA: radical SAM protein [Firmicutes bacterium]|nr:radical SAM protein [Bacillota bacterium]